MHDLKVRKYDGDKLLRNDFFFFHEVSRFGGGGGGQGLSSLPLSSVGDICRPFVIPRFLSIIPRFVARNGGKFSREPEPIPLMLYDYTHRIILSNPILFSPWRNTWIPRITRVEDGHISPLLPAFHEIRSNDVSRPSRYICINCLEGGRAKSRIIHSGNASAYSDGFGGGLRRLMRDIS